MAKVIIPRSSQDLALHRPEPMVPEADLPAATARSDPDDVAGRLLQGGSVLIRDAYPTGLKVLSHLRERVFGGGNEDAGKISGIGRVDIGKGSKIGRPEIAIGRTDKNDFRSYRGRRAAYRDASNRLFVPVSGNRIALKKAPGIGWLDELYPDIADFLLPFPQVQGLNSSWQWFLRGVRFPGLRHEIYPWYGTYFPTRFDHLQLFGRWVERHAGGKKSAMDVGTGCGVLAFMMLERGFEHVLATDINPNAVMTVRENARHRGMDERIDAHVSNLFDSSLFDGYDIRTNLIVCNPPWLPGLPERTADSDHPWDPEQAEQIGHPARQGATEQPDLLDTAEPPVRHDHSEEAVHSGEHDAGPGLMDLAIYYEPGFFERLFSGAVRHLEQDGRLVILFSNLGLKERVRVSHPVEDELANNRRFVKVQMLRQKAKPPSKKTRRRDHRKEEYVELWELALRR